MCTVDYLPVGDDVTGLLSAMRKTLRWAGTILLVFEKLIRGTALLTGELLAKLEDRTTVAVALGVAVVRDGPGLIAELRVIIGLEGRGLSSDPKTIIFEINKAKERTPQK